MMSRIEIKANGVTSKILIDGVEPARVRTVRFEHTAGQAPKLILEHLAFDTIIEGEVEVERIAICAKCREELKQEAKDAS